MKKTFLLTTIIIALLTISNLSFATPTVPRSAVPPLPATPTPITTPAVPAGIAQGNHVPPIPGKMRTQVEQARARQAMEAALAKYLRYWGPRYQVAPIEVTVEGEWAHGVAKWQGQVKTLSGPIHILAHRLPDGTWQALLPGTDGAYLQWLEAMPEHLMPAGEKSQLRAQAAEAEALQRSQAAPAVPQGMKETGEPANLAAEQMQPTVTPTPALWFAGGKWETYTSLEFGYSVRYPSTLQLREVRQYQNNDIPSDLWIGESIHIITRIPPLPEDAFLSPIWKSAAKVTLHQGIEALKLERLSEPMGGGTSRLTIEYLIRTKGADFFLIYDPPVPSDEERRLFETIVSTFTLISQRTYTPPAATQSVGALAAQTDGFDFPVDPRDGSSGRPPWYAGYNVQNPYVSGWSSCYSKPLNQLQHAGEDWFRSAGSNVYAVANGRVIWSDKNANYPGGVVIIEHTLPPGVSNPWGGNLIYSMYGHLDPNSLISQWADVTRGQLIGKVYNWGSNSHVHFEVRRYGNMQQAPEWVNGYHFCNTSWPGPGYTDTNAHPDWFGYTHPSNWIDGHRPGGGGGSCDATSVPSGYSKCAEEGEHCNFSGTQQVYYGANSCYKVKSFTNGVDCNNNNFGDPLPGVHKACYVSNPSSGCDATSLPSGYIKCADENGYCSFSGTQQVYYGADSCYKVKTFTDGVACNNNNFGDPLPGVGKACYVPPSCNPNADQIALYANTGYGGNCVTLGVGDYPNPGYLGSLGNDNAESIRVGSNVQAILYEHDNYQGRSETFTSNDSNLGDNYIGANSVSSVKVQWRIQPPAPPAPQSPPNGAVFNEGQGINLSWSATGNEYYGEIWGGPGGTLTFGWQSGTSKDIGPQWAGYTYSWHVKARNGAGTSDWSSTWTFTVKPAAPSNLSAQTASCSQVNLYWTDNSGNEEGYKIYRNGSYVGQVGMNTTSYQDTGLNGNTSYSYYVRAFRSSIESDASNTVNITTPSCAPPQPDLVASQWGGWQYPIVPSSITGTTEVNTLYANQPTYIDWGISNIGNAECGGDAYGDLYIDSTRLAHYNFGNVLAGWTWAFFDWMETINTPGWHTLKFVADPDNIISESDETNNVWERQFYWIPSAPYADDMEDGTNGWAATGLWHQVGASSPYPASHSWSHSWWYGQDGTGNYNTGGANSGDLTSPPVYIPSTGYYLRFWYRYETETQGQDWDQRWVQISVDGGAFNNVLQLSDDPMMRWLQSPAIDLSGYAGHTIQVRFHFDTIDGYFNDYRGWYIDDFEISTTPPPSCADSHEPNNTPAQATAIAYGQTLSADICPGGDYDFYRFTGTAGDRVVVDIDARINGSLLDSYIFLLDSDGTSVLAEHDDEITYEVQDSHLGYHLPHDGTYYIKVKAWNHPSVGGTGYFYTIRLLTDDANPSSAQITSPGNDAWLDPNLETITVSATDHESGVRNVGFLWHSADWQGSEWVWLGDDWDGRDGWSWDFDTSSLPEQRGGAFYIWAFDWVGNWTGAGVWNLGIDRTPPTTSISVSPMYGDAPFRDFHVWWYADDNLSSAAGYDVQYRDGADGAWTSLVTGTTDTYYHFVGQDGHTYYFRAQAYDYAGNRGNYSNETSYTVQTCSVAADFYETDNTPAYAWLIETDGKLQMHNFHVEQDQDWVKFIALPGITYTLATTNTGGHADTVLYLYDRDSSTLLGSNDDDPANWPASRLIWQAPTAGTYYIKVEHWDPYAHGCTTGYGLSVTPDRPIHHSYLPVILRNR